MFSSPTSDPNPKNKTSNTTAIKDNLSYIAKFGLPASVAQHIDFCFILNDVHIDNLTIVSNVKLNSWVLNCLESYQLSQSLVVDYMLEVFREEFHGWGYTEFSRLDQNIRRILKETLMAKGIYMGRPSGHVNQRLANLVIDEQLPVWDESELLEYKSMYPESKAWVLFELRHSHPSRRITPSVEVDINPIDDQRQQTFTPEPPKITPDPANAFDSIPPIRQPTITPGPAQIDSVLPADLPQQPFNASANPYTQIPPIRVPNEMLPATIVAQFVKIWDKNSNYTGEAYDILDDKIRYFLDTCYTVAIKQSQFHAVFLSILSGRAKDYFVYNVNQNLTFAEMYNQMKTKFDTEVNKAQYHTDWSLLTYSSFKAEKSNIGKTNLEVLQTLLDKLQLCQRALGLGYMGENQLIAATQRACHGVSELEFTLFTPATTFEELSSKL